MERWIKERGGQRRRKELRSRGLENDDQDIPYERINFEKYITRF